MGIFSNKKKATPAKAEAKKEKTAKSEVKVTTFSANNVLIAPRITEKAARVSDDRVYTFDVAPRATKTDIIKAIKAVYNVTPIKVNVSSIPTKRVYRQKHIGVKRGGRKAYVFLKKGDKIEFI